MDMIFTENLDQTIVNIRQGVAGLNKSWMQQATIFYYMATLKRKKQAKEKQN